MIAAVPLLVTYQPPRLRPRTFKLVEWRLEMHAGRQWLRGTRANGEQILLHVASIRRRVKVPA